ncbi:MAG: imelysin family protein [Gemmatimonadota bacterium]
MGDRVADYRFQDAARKLVERGAQRIVVVPLLASRFSGHYDHRSRMMKKMRRGMGGVGILLAAAGCGRGEAELEAMKGDVVATYAEIVHASYEDSFRAVEEMAAAIAVLLAAPSEESLAAARIAWLAAREPYGQTEAYRFYGGPIDAAGGPETLLNPWPLDEGYVDYVEGAPESGIVNDVAAYPKLDRELLVSLNEAGAEENLSVGFHAIEFLLWGQDLFADGPGRRPYTDYVAGVGRNAERRIEYLRIVTELQVEKMEGLVAEWAPNDATNYRTSFLALPRDEAVRRILVGIGVLAKSELAGERMFTAYDNQDQEDEHSCFSDNTHRDIAANALGLMNVLQGHYRRSDGSTISGVGMTALFREVDSELADEVEALATRSLRAVEAIPVPFDQAIVDPDSRPAVLDAVYALMDLGDRIAEGGSALGLTINTALPG